LDRCHHFGIPVKYLPCTETIYLGKNRNPGYYAGRLDTKEFMGILTSSEKEVRELITKEGPPIAIIGVDSSPVCGVNSTWFDDSESNPVKISHRGIFLSMFSDIPAYDVYDAACWKVYLASPLFSEGERDFNKKLAEILSNYSLCVYLPQDSGDSDSNRAHTKIRYIFENNLKELDLSDMVIAVIDGADTDSGTAWEIGYAYAKGKPVISIRTDFRNVGVHESVNLMLEQSSAIVRDIPSLLSHIPCPIILKQE